MYIYAIMMVLPLIALMTSCEPSALQESDVFTQEDQLDQILQAENPEGYDIYHINDFLDKFMTEEGNFASESSPYRSRATNGNGIFLYSVDTLPSVGKGIYIRGRVTTDDFSGNFYKALVIQEVVNGEQQNLRISVDMGSSGGLYQLGQEILIRCNGLAVGRYANQPQLCVPAYNNNIYAMNATQKVGWAPGRIPAPKFRNATRMLGVPDQSKIKYDTISLVKLFKEIPFKADITLEGMDVVRKADGRLIVISNVHFTGQANDNGSATPCVYAHPDSANLANVFAPTTGNVGYPQSRVMQNSAKTQTICCSCSEYCKFAYFFLPGAREDEETAVKFCERYSGTVTGILGWYQDNAANLNSVSGNEWSITPRGIIGIGVPDIIMKDSKGTAWVPKEFDPAVYQEFLRKKWEQSLDPILPPIRW